MNVGNAIKITGKYLDQPLLMSKFSAAVPAVLTTGAIGYGLHDTFKAPEGKKKKAFIQNACVLGATVASALIATRGMPTIKIFGKKIIKGFNGLTDIESVKEVKKAQSQLIDNFLKENPFKGKVAEILVKAKSKVLKRSEVKFLHRELSKSDRGKTLLQELIPDPENIGSKEIFGEIGRLSIMGLVPVLGGIAGGVAGDAITEKHWQKKFPDKIKEGFYQYFANIFLCNVGAGAALGIMEKMKVKSKVHRAAGMIAGIMATGVIGGSAIANYLAKKFVNPIFDKHSQNKVHSVKELYSERTPEAIDIGLHVDDIATVAVMSGLKWIEPSLPILYSVSGYRAGIGYRNGDSHHCLHKKSHNKEPNSFEGKPYIESYLKRIKRIQK